MIRKRVRQRLTALLLLAAASSVGSYALLRGDSETPGAAPKTVTELKPSVADVPAGTSKSRTAKDSVHHSAVPKPASHASTAIQKDRAGKLVDARAIVAATDSNGSAATRKLNPAAAKVPVALAASNPRALKSTLPGKLRAMPAPAPQGGSGTPPNAPTLKTPTDTSTGNSTSPTLSVSVSDPSSSNVTVNFYGKLVSSSAPGPNFQIIELPDTQYYSASLQNGSPAIFNSQTQWIVNNWVANNIVFVTGLGDVVQDGNNNGNYSEWVNANAAVSLLDDPNATGLPQGIPYSFGVGNHDQGPSGDGSPDDTAGFNQYFGASRYAAKSYYGGHYGSDNDNHYMLFSASGMNFILINIAYMDPQYDGAELNSVLAWANGLLQTYSNRRAIVVSHYMLNNGFNASWSGQGQVMYNALKGNANLFLMLAGHLTPPEGQRSDVYGGNRVFTFLSDYQESGFGGDGWLRILNFLPATNQIHVQTYSPWINQFENTSAGDFTVSYDMLGNGNGFTLLASNTGVISGNTTSMTWPSLASGSKYEWYVTVSNSTGTAVGPLWTFTTAGGSSPAVSLSPTSLTFPSQTLNTTSASQSVTLTNTGAASLAISSIAASAQYAQTNTCGSSVSAGGSCTISVTFTPTATGSQTGSITITDNATGSPHSVALTGTGASAATPAVSLSPSSLTFGSAAVAFVQDGGATGSGSTTLAVKLPSNVAKNNLLIVGASSYAGNAFAAPAITDTLGATWTQAVYYNPGTAGTPALAAIYYAVAPSSGADTVTVHMTGTNNLHLHVYEISGLLTSAVLDQIGSSFQSSGTAASVSTTAPTTSPNEFVFGYFARDNGSGTWTTGSGYGNVLATPNSGSGTDAFSEDKTVTATGTQTATATSSASDALTSLIATFKAGGGGTAVGTTSAAQSLTLTNTGSGSLSISSIVASGDFGQTNNCGSFVAAAGTCTINVTFSPTATGTRTGSITFTDSASNSPQVYNLTGIGTPASGPVANLSVTTLSFGNQTVNTSSASQAVTLSNVGSTAMGITSIVPSSQYSETDSCGSSVAAGGNCTINVTFTPTATGSQPGTLTITDSAPGSPQSVTLSGSGTAALAPAVTLAPTSLTFSGQALNTTSAAQSITLTNSGTASLTISSIAASAQYSDTTTCGATLAAGANCSISVTFTPTATGSQTGSITITDNAAGSPHSVNLTGTGTAPGVNLSPASLTFGSQALNTTSAAQSVTLTNSGAASLTITSIVASAQYSDTTTCGATLAAGANCSISVKFTPTAAGTQTGTITITDSATGSPHTVNLTGTGTSSPGVSLSPTSLTFASQTVNTTSAAQSITLTNTGTATLTITSIVASAQYADTTTCGASLLAGANCSISVTFTPTATGTQTGTITITDSATGSPQTVNLTGTGAAPNSPAVSLSPSSLTFASQTVNTTSAAQSITLTNSGTAALTINSIVASAQYADTTTCGASLAAGANCSISVTFTPTATGTQTGTITITDNAAGSPHVVGLTGTGASSGTTTVSLSPASLTFSLQQINTTSSSKTVTLTNTGSSTLTLTSIVASGDFTQTNGCGTSLIAAAHCSITVRFVPTITGADSGTLTITDNATGSPQVVPLTGTGANITISPTTLSFGSQSVGTTSAAQTSTVTNLGVSTVTITRISENSSQYAQTNTCGTSLAGGASCTISVTFSPTTTGSHSASVTFTDNVTGDASKITLTGSGQ